tara:strand:- start:853 stop:2184 length:1332 start_codon:yes stop_codon:yes gene_type:complete
MNQESSVGAPIRHPIDFEHHDFLNEKKLDEEMRRVFDICHGCRRCFNLCDSFPTLFELIDASEEGEVKSLNSNKFGKVVDACTFCDMCFMTKCPYVPPHEFNLDFPHLMFRYRTFQKKHNKLAKIPSELANIDRNARFGIMFNKIVNWMLDIRNKFFRKILEITIGVDRRVILPKYNNETFENFIKKNKDDVNKSAPGFGRKAIIYSTCFVNYNKKNTGIAALKVLKKNGVDVQHIYPGCCGMPYFEQADPKKVCKQAVKVSKELIKWINKGYEIITLTASCSLMLKIEWPLLLPKDEDIKKLSINTKDIDEYIVELSKKEGLTKGLDKIDGGVSIHHACHARAQNMGNKARDMLKLIPNIKIDIIEKCAGHGGTFGVMKKSYDIANKVGNSASEIVNRKKNKYLASDCPLAGKHLKQLEKDTNISNEEALHPIELIAKSYKL